MRLADIEVADERGCDDEMVPMGSIKGGEAKSGDILLLFIGVEGRGAGDSSGSSSCNGEASVAAVTC